MVYYHALTGITMNRWTKGMYYLLIFFVLYLIVEIVRKMLGGSLGFEELTIGLLIANLGYSFYLNSKFSEHIGWHRAEKRRG